MKDKSVIVLGTGCSAAQFVPHLIKERFNAKKVVQLMRSPPWICPKTIPPGGDENWSKNAPFLLTWVPGLLRLLRFAVAAGAEMAWPMFVMSESGAKARKATEAQLLRRMKHLAPEKYWDILTPNYSVCCKRRIFDLTVCFLCRVHLPVRLYTHVRHS
jgi:cation diffusion facilitator CzcD-associated flavoprotein CzcO